MAGLLTGTYGLPGAVTGLGKLSRLRSVTVLKSPVPLDELQDRNVVGVFVRDVAGLGVLRNHDQRNARAVAEEIQRLHIAGVIVAAAFVEGDEDRCVLPTASDWPCTASTIFLVKPSNRSSFEDAGWPSTSPLGLTKETAGRVPFLMSAYRLAVSWMCAVRTAALAMIEVSYWKGLQMLQYSSVFLPIAP